jgi:hypothetical protein
MSAFLYQHTKGSPHSLSSRNLKPWVRFIFIVVSKPLVSVCQTGSVLHGDLWTNDIIEGGFNVSMHVFPFNSLQNAERVTYMVS